MRYLVTAVPGRARFVPYLQRHIPNLEVVWDQRRDHMHTFLLACKQAGDDPVIRLEDDIILTKDFTTKVEDVVAEHPDHLIQFFSMRKKDLEIGSRWEPGASYLMNQCFYLPAGMSKQIIDFHASWEWQQFQHAHPNGSDLMLAKFLQQHRLRYWLQCPSLVDHLQLRSEIDGRRSSRRQSKTFIDPETGGFPDGMALD